MEPEGRGKTKASWCFPCEGVTSSGECGNIVKTRHSDQMNRLAVGQSTRAQQAQRVEITGPIC